MNTMKYQMLKKKTWVIIMILKESSDKEESLDLSDIPPLEGDEEEVKEGKGLRFLTKNKLLTRLPILLVKIKAGNNSYKLKNEIRKILYLLHKHKKITKKFYNNLISHYNHGRKYDCDKRSLNFLF